MKSQTILQSAMDIPKNPLDKSEMRCTRSMHMKTDLMHNIGNVRSGKGEILKCTSQTSILSSVRQELALGVRKLRLSINRSSCRVAVSHASTLKNIHGILAL
jgi:hypothetical protein